MRSKVVSVRIPLLIYPKIEQYSKRKGYKNVSAYFVSRCFVSLQDERREKWVRDLANANRSLQDFLIEKMFEWPDDIHQMAKMLQQQHRPKQKV